MEQHTAQPNSADAPVFFDEHEGERTSEVYELTMHQRLTRRIGAPLAGVVALLTPTAAELAAATPAHAESNIEYTVTNTEGGVFTRNSPHTNDTPRIPGQGAYDGDRVRLICGVTNGDAVGPYDNNTWHKVINLSRPHVGEFWLNDRHVASPNKADQLAPGEPNCNPETNPQSEPQATDEKGKCRLGMLSHSATSLAQSEGGSVDFEWKRQLSNESQSDICIRAKFGKPDLNNHRQFIGKVIAYSPAIKPAGCDEANLIQIWGDDFYETTNCTNGETWEINKWLDSGTSVCAAISTATSFKYFKTTEEANEAVRSGEIALGQNTPERLLTCFEIKA